MNRARSADARNQQQQRVSQLAAGPVTVTGLIETTRSGYVVEDVDFDWRFTQMPAFFGGFALDINQTFETDSIPGLERIAVVRWSFDTRADNGDRYYTGCTIGATITGTGDDMRGVISYMFVGQAMPGEWDS